ncbi:Pre-mRNA-splicing factor [Lachnellula hyalina]|uniref:Pre-mRNA-splicing factor n=1 Tax=Lachnellula hyalina TaxID=1316788 RepID=A0A8H8R900_9HELO|nr:Pre-mRNA-splicing factor [Lachnellula hyalina]TVY30635.1 Pre-mRNA-splicing factor [Lachnellula hyalina]
MPPQIKQDLNRSGWETTDFPSVCENCLPENPYVQMIKQDYGEECKICTRPFTVFKWKADRTSRSKRTNICLTCARLKNCCQCCMLDLSFGLPIVVRDAALKMVAPGPQSEVNREYYAQEHEKEIEDGRGGVEAYEKTDEKARELLRRLANSQPYFKKQRRIGGVEGEGVGESASALQGGAGPIRTRDTRGGGASARGAGAGRGGRGGTRGGRSFPSAAQLPPTEQDILPPRDQTVMSLFVTGVEDDLPEHKIREFFSPYGKLRSLVCSHMSHCAFINYATREAAEAAAEALQGKAVIAGCPLRVQWGRPKPIGTMDRDERIATGREGRSAFSNPRQRAAMEGGDGQGGYAQPPPKDDLANMSAVAPPPGASDVDTIMNPGRPPRSLD